MKPTESVRVARHGDLPRLSACLAEAFRRDPLHRWALPRESQWRRCSRRLWALALRRSIASHAVFTTEQLHGLAVWEPPGSRSGFLLQVRDGVRAGSIVGPRALLLARGLWRIRASRPHSTHYYLYILGTKPEFQGRGIGSSLLAEGLSRCDAVGSPVYLEASHRENIAFYERHGFEICRTIRVTPQVQVWGMWREPSHS